VENAKSSKRETERLRCKHDIAYGDIDVIVCILEIARSKFGRVINKTPRAICNIEEDEYSAS